MVVDVHTDPFKKVLSIPLVDSSRDDILMRGSGYHTDSTVTLSANNATETVNIFQITEAIEIVSIQAEITDATTLTNCTDVSLQVWDGSVADQITKQTPGADISGFNVGGFLIKNEIASSLLSVINNDQGRIVEGSTSKQFSPFTIMQKIGTSTYIRMKYSTTDTPINAQIEWHIVWKPVNGGNLVAV